MKLADNYKGKVLQSQLTAAVVPVPVQMTGFTAAYPKAYSGAPAPVGYTYPQPMATYPNAPYASPPPAAPYSVQSHFSFPQYAVKKETPPAPTGLGGYPYYMPKQ